MRTVGVEEEFLLLGHAGAPVGVAPEAAGGGVQLELKEEMLETGTVPCLTLEIRLPDVRFEGARWFIPSAPPGACRRSLGCADRPRPPPCRRGRRGGDGSHGVAADEVSAVVAGAVEATLA